jgi:hypothetical protein
MPRFAWLVSFASLLAACTPIGVVPSPPSAGPTRQTPPATRVPPSARPAAEDIAYYRRVSKSLADRDIEAAKRADFARFRRGSMLLRHGGGPAAEAQLRPAMKKNDVEEIRKAASAMVAEDAAHITAHVILTNLDTDAGRKAEAELHDVFVAGMLRSILGSGDGRGYGGAFTVYFIREEYDLARALGAQVLGQSLAHQGPRSYDILNVRTKSGAEREIYFDITEVFAEEGKLFGFDK